MKQSEVNEQPYIPVKVIRFILDHRRRRLAAEAEVHQQAAAAEAGAAGTEAEALPSGQGERDD